MATPAGNTYNVVPTILTCCSGFHHPMGRQSVTHCFLTTKTVNTLCGVGTSVSNTRINYRKRVNITYSVTTTKLARLLNNDPTRMYGTTRVTVRRGLKLAYSPITKRMRVPYVRHGTVGTIGTMGTTQVTVHHASTPHISLSGIVRAVCRANGSVGSGCHRASHKKLTVGIIYN